MEKLWKKLRDSGLTDSQIRDMIEEKKKQFGGLLSEEGALTVIVSEVLKEEEKYLKIADLLPGMENLNIVARILGIFESEFRRKDSSRGKVGTVLLGDESGKIVLTLWDDECELLKNLRRGDPVKIVGGIVNEGRRGLQIFLKKGRIIINPDDPRVESLPSLSKFVEGFERKNICDLKENDKKIEVRGTICKLYQVRFYDACPDCYKKVEFVNNAYYCKNCGKNVQRKKVVILDLGVDDSSGYLRASFFDDVAERILDSEAREVYFYVKEYMNKGFDARSAGEAYMNEKQYRLLGREIVLSGDVEYNEYTGMTLRVREFSDVDVLEECGRILEEFT